MKLTHWIYSEADRLLFGKVLDHPQLADGSDLTIHGATLTEGREKAITLTGEIELGPSYAEMWGEAGAWPLL